MRDGEEHCGRVDVQDVKNRQGHHQVVEVPFALLQTEADHAQEVAQKSRHEYGKLKLCGSKTLKII